MRDSFNIRVTADADPEVRNTIASGLALHNAKMAGSPQALPLNVLILDDQQTTIGGLWGRTFWHWLYVELLFVPPYLRGKNCGARLLASAEKEARSRMCIGICLDTFAFQAPGFYERLGYSRIGTIKDYPPGSERIFLTKRL